jgi:hypothetical protein
VNCASSAAAPFRWSKRDVEISVRRERDGRGEAPAAITVSREDLSFDLIFGTRLVVPRPPFGNTRWSLSQERDRGFESALLQQRVCKLSVPLAKCVNQYRTGTRCPGADERHVGAQPVRTNLSTLRSWVNPA